MELELKPDFDEAARRWAAYLQGEIIDRPLVCVHTRREGVKPAGDGGYRGNMYDDPAAVVERHLEASRSVIHGGEAIPSTWFSFGPDEIAFFCGAEVMWDDESGDTNWSAPCIDDWDSALPFSMANNPLWQRMLELYRLAAERYAGRMIVSPIDLHTNMDLLAAVRGPQQLCLDLVDCPEKIDEAMISSRALFRPMWDQLVEAGKMSQAGFGGALFSPEGSATLQCDFSYMISPEMFNRWVMPALEEEASIVKHADYHWDGPGARVHEDAILGSRGLNTISYVFGQNEPPLCDHLPFFQRMQAAGKGVSVFGTPDEIKTLHSELRPEKVIYRTWVKTEAHVNELLKWFVDHT